MTAERAGVVDVGSNTVRLLVSSGGAPILEDVAYPRLGERIAERGRMGPDGIAAAAKSVAGFVDAAFRYGAERVEVVVTAPARTAADAGELLVRLREASSAPVRPLSEREEAELVFAGALAAVGDVPEPVAVCDVGGGSTELAVGTRAEGPSWLRSIPFGSAAPPAEPFLDQLSPPPAATALASGGSARALGRLVGPVLGARELERARLLVDAGKTEDLPDERVQTLPAGVMMLAGLQRLLALPLHVSAGGLREGALLRLL